MPSSNARGRRESKRPGGDILNHSGSDAEASSRCTKKELFRYLPLIFIVLVISNVYLVYHRGLLASVDPHRRGPPGRRTLDQQIQELLADDPAQAVDSPNVHPYHKAAIHDHMSADHLAEKQRQDANSEASPPKRRPILAPNPIHDPVAERVAGGNDAASDEDNKIDFRARGDGELKKDRAVGAFSVHGAPYCLDTLQHREGQKPGTYACHGQGGSQNWAHQIDGTISNPASGLCLGTKGTDTALNTLVLLSCTDPNTAVRMHWQRVVVPSDHNSAQFRLIGSGEVAVTQQGGLCLTKDGAEVVLSLCDFTAGTISHERQRWQIDTAESYAQRKRDAQKHMQRFDFNEEASREIGIRRERPDLRHANCKNRDFGTRLGLKLKPTAVIFCFVNEEWYALLRSVHSVIDGSPPELLQEIILVDDGSDAEWLQQPLEDYIRDHLPPFVRLVRHGARLGLIRARLTGAREAKAPILTFLDSHIEVNEGWLPPLLERVTADPKVAACPIITVIGQEFLEHQTSIDHVNTAYGVFDWALTFRWAYSRTNPPVGARRTDLADPIKSPTMAGGLFTIDRQWFWDSGSYDDQMEGWGGENIEMSFRLWQCGGSIEIVPCSVVGHIFRKKNPSPFKKNVIFILRHNLKRLAAVWMDEYAELFYSMNPGARNEPTGNISSRLAVRETCKSFKWYLDNVYPSLSAPLPGTVRGKGAFRTADGAHCLDFQSGSPNAGGALIAPACSSNRQQQQVQHLETYQITGTAWPASVLCIETRGEGVRPLWAPCDRDSEKQRWELDEQNSESGSLVRLQSDRNQCLGLKSKSQVWVLQCNDPAVQKWLFDDNSWGGRRNAPSGSRPANERIRIQSAEDRVKKDEALVVVPKSVRAVGTAYVALSRESLACAEGAHVDWPLGSEGSEVAASLQECAEACESAKNCDSFSRSVDIGDCWLKNSGGRLCGVAKPGLPKSAGAAAVSIVSESNAALFSPKGCRPKPGYVSYTRTLCRSSAGRVLNLAQRVEQKEAGVVTLPYTGSRFHGALGLDKETGEPLWVPKPVPSHAEQRTLNSQHGFNASLSQSLPLDRDVRSKAGAQCAAIDYGDLSKLPDTSVVFVFCNEEQSVLLRSVHSVLNRSPPQLLKEIILVDDGSDAPHLGAPLQEYVDALGPKVRLIRQGSRTGLVQARLAGMRAATAETVTVLDSHIEVQERWLEPLMSRMRGDETRVVIPIIDGMNAKTFHDDAGGIQLCGFLWSMVEHGIPLQRKDAAANHNRCCDPQPSPVMAGGLFSINRHWFLDTLGGYDTGISFWGTENLEMSFRVWMCGGTLEMMPCSRVYHIFRTMGGKPYHVPGNTGTVNKLRTIHGWLGPKYAKYALSQLGTHALDADYGDMTEVRAVQDRLQCKDFDWFMHNVYPDNVLIRDLEHAPFHGQIRLSSNGLNSDGDRCLSVASRSKFMLAPCASKDTAIYASQEFFLAASGQLRLASKLDSCLEYSSARGTISMPECGSAGTSRRANTNQLWQFSLADGVLKHRGSNLCVSGSQNALMEACDSPGVVNSNFQWDAIE